MSIYLLKKSLFLEYYVSLIKKKKLQWAEMGHVRTQYYQVSDS